MKPVKYKFNPDSLSFDKIRLGAKAIFLRLLAYLIASVLIAVVLNFMYGLFFDTPKEKALKREICLLYTSDAADE